jgi:hypothetical protein
VKNFEDPELFVITVEIALAFYAVGFAWINALPRRLVLATTNCEDAASLC